MDSAIFVFEPHNMAFFNLHLSPPSLDVSVVIPVHDEEANVMRLAREIASALSATRWSWECVWVDDGSRDNTLAVITKLCAVDDHHRFVVMERNYGQSAALSAGLEFSRGALIAMIDGDGQNDPADLPDLIDTLTGENLDLVNSFRARSRFGPVRRLSSRIANGFRNRMTGENVRDVGCSMRVMRREYLEGIPVFKGMHRFLPTLLRMNGCRRIAEVPVTHRARWAGKSKYGISNRLWVGIADTLAVRWMARRMISPQVRTTSPQTSRSSLGASKEAYR